MHFRPDKANLAEIQPENHQNVQKTHFLQKAPGVNGLMRLRKSQNIADEEQLQNWFFFDRGKDMAINALSTKF